MTKNYIKENGLGLLVSQAVFGDHYELPAHWCLTGGCLPGSKVLLKKEHGDRWSVFTLGGTRCEARVNATGGEVEEYLSGRQFRGKDEGCLPVARRVGQTVLVGPLAGRNRGLR